MPWQWGQLGLTEDDGNRLIKYEDAIVDGVSDGMTLVTLLNLTRLFLPRRRLPQTTVRARFASRSTSSSLSADPLMLLSALLGNTFYANQTQVWDVFT